MVSGQFIQFRNLDFVDGTDRYTADPATMHLTNGLQRGWENKEFYSLFFSKPFGESQLGRWNNITIYEEGGAGGTVSMWSTPSVISWWVQRS